MKKTRVKIIFVFATLIALLFSYQNCSRVIFSGVKSNDSNHAIDCPDCITKCDNCEINDITFTTDAESLATIAFEDLYPDPGDADYNDFMLNFNIKETMNEKKFIKKITMDFSPKAHGSGYDHKFILVMDGIKDAPSNVTAHTMPMFQGGAMFKLTYYDQQKNVLRTVDSSDATTDLTIWPSIRNLYRNTDGSVPIVVNATRNGPHLEPLETAKLEIELLNPELNPSPGTIDIRKYRMMIHVIDSNQDIDLVDVNPAHIDVNGYPFGFVIPANIKHCLEYVKVDRVFTYFENYRQYLLAKNTDPSTPEPEEKIMKWYNTINPGQENNVFNP